MPLILAAPLPSFAPPGDQAGVSRLCARWERHLEPRLSPCQRAHCSRFGNAGDALRGRVSRLLARVLALRVLPQGSRLDMDERGCPRVTGACGWHVAFSHSGHAAFSLVLRPGETARLPEGRAALDAEATDAPPSTDRCFPAPSPTPRAALRRWLLAEALFKGLGADPEHWKAAAVAAHGGSRRAAGRCALEGTPFSWRFVPAPGHALCVALSGGLPFSAALRWFAWQSFLK